MEGVDVSQLYFERDLLLHEILVFQEMSIEAWMSRL